MADLRRTRVLARRSVRTSRPGYAVSRTVGGVLGLLLVGGSALSILPTTLHQEGQERLTLPEQMTRLVVDAPRGDVVVTEIGAGSGAAPGARLSTGWTFTEPTVTVDQGDDGEVTLAARCTGNNLGSCSADLEVQVPAGTAVRVVTSYGDIDLTGTGALEAQASAGDILVRGRPTSVTATTGLGELTVNAAAAPQDLTLSSNFGNIDVELPASEEYAVTTSTDLGEARVGVPTDPAAPHTVNIRSSFGDITVEASG